MKDKINVNFIEFKSMYESEGRHWWYVALRELLFTWIKKFNVVTVLDAGCGTGMNMFKLKKMGYKIFGIDASDNALQFCRNRKLYDVKRAYIQSIPYESEKFDCVYSLDVICMLSQEDIVSSFMEFNRCLHSKGILIIHAATLQFLYSSHDVVWNIKKRYSKKDLEYLLKKTGFDIKFSTYRICLFFPFIAFVKLCEKLKLIFYSKHIDKIKSDVNKTNTLINVISNPIMKFENWLLSFTSLPLGTSLFIVAQKK